MPGRAPVSPSLQRVVAAARRINRALVHVDPAADAPNVAAEIEERRKWREARDAEASTEAKIEETKDEGEPEVSSA